MNVFKDLTDPRKVEDLKLIHEKLSPLRWFRYLKEIGKDQGTWEQKRESLAIWIYYENQDEVIDLFKAIRVPLGVFIEEWEELDLEYLRKEEWEASV